MDSVYAPYVAENSEQLGVLLCKNVTALIYSLKLFSIEVPTDEVVDEFMHALLESLSEVSRCRTYRADRGSDYGLRKLVME